MARSDGTAARFSRSRRPVRPRRLAGWLLAGVALGAVLCVLAAMVLALAWSH